MIAVDVKATNAPIHPNFGPAILANEPISPRRAAFPIANSVRISGTDQRRRKQTQAIRKEPPPFDAATRGNRQMFSSRRPCPAWPASFPSGT